MIKTPRSRHIHSREGHHLAYNFAFGKGIVIRRTPCQSRKRWWESRVDRWWEKPWKKMISSGPCRKAGRNDEIELENAPNATRPVGWGCIFDERAARRQK